MVLCDGRELLKLGWAGLLNTPLQSGLIKGVGQGHAQANPECSEDGAYSNSLQLFI